MTSIKAVDSTQVKLDKSVSKPIQNSIKEDDNIFAKSFRSAGMDSVADFLRDDWSANMARKMGFNDFADWIDNKPDENNIKDEGFFSNIGREMVKHPVLTLAAIVGTVFAGKSIYKALAKNKANAIPDASFPKGGVTTTATVGTVTSTTSNLTTQEVSKLVDDVPIKSLDDQISELNKTIAKGIEYERSISYKNLEIFDNISEAERMKIFNRIESSDIEKDFFLFASGSKPTFAHGNRIDMYDCLASDKLKVAELWNATEKNLLVNQKEARKVIEKNREFFALRFDMPKTSTTDDILEMISKGWKNKLADSNKYNDIRYLLEGSIENNAYYAQFYQDIRNEVKYSALTGEKCLFDRCGKDLALFKKGLKEFMETDASSYKNLPQNYKNKIHKMIDLISEEEFRLKQNGSKNLFKNDEYKLNEIKILKNLAKKLENAQKTGGKITFN